MKKVVIKLNSLDDHNFFLFDGVIKKNPMQAASSIQGIVSMELNTKDNKITIIGYVDPVEVVEKLRKWNAKIDTVGPAKEEKKPEKPPAVTDKKEDDKKVPTEEEQMAMLLQYYKNYNYHPHYIQPYPIHIYEGNPNGCVIC